MDWILFFTIAVQVLLGAVVLSFASFILSSAVKTLRGETRRSKNTEVQAPPYPKRTDG